MRRPTPQFTLIVVRKSNCTAIFALGMEMPLIHIHISCRLFVLHCALGIDCVLSTRRYWLQDAFFATIQQNFDQLELPFGVSVTIIKLNKTMERKHASFIRYIQHLGGPKFDHFDYIVLFEPSLIPVDLSNAAAKHCLPPIGVGDASPSPSSVIPF